MYATRNSIEDYMKNEEFIIEVHLTIEFTSKSIYVAHNSIEDYMKNEEFIIEVHSSIEFPSK
jgi:hypothetical protein